MPARRVLIVDDDVDLAESFADYLRLDGHVVDTAYSGEDGLKAARSQAYALIVIDVGLPDVNGVETTRRIHRARPGARIVLVTGLSASHMAQAGIDAGLVEVLTKPVDPELLRQRLEGGEAR